MKTIKLFTLLAALLCTTSVMAQSPTIVTTENELRTAVQTNNANIQFGDDITIGSNIQITDNRTVTIDLDNHTLNRGLTDHGSNGQCIYVASRSTLYLSNGTLTGGWGGDSGGLLNRGTANLTNVNITDCRGINRGGGICNYGTLTMTGGSITNNVNIEYGQSAGGGGVYNDSNATATFTGVTISGNRANWYGGGGINNLGTVTLDGCTITGNSCNANGGGVWSGPGSTLNMQGQNTVTDNNTGTNNPDTHRNSNIYLREGVVITVTGSLEGSSIGITLVGNTGTFTSGYGTHNSGIDPVTLFFSDLPRVYHVTPVGNEAQITLLEAFDYIERSWDEENKVIVNTQKTLSNLIPTNNTPTSDEDYKIITGGSGEFTMGGKTNDYPEIYMVYGTLNRDILRVKGTNVHLVLCDGANLNVQKIVVNHDYQLYIHVQSYGTSMGKLTADYSDSNNGDAGIGAEEAGGYVSLVPGPGLIEIHGGDIYAKGALHGAGIGGGDNGKGGTIVIYGGKIRAIGGYGGVWDGGGGAGIGGGNFGSGANLTIYGGTVSAEGGLDAAGVGSGNGGNLQDYADDPVLDGGTFTMYGGYLYAYGAANGAGIGGGEYSSGPVAVNIYGGKVYAYGGEDAAGIGTGYFVFDDIFENGEINIYGGEVHAEGEGEGAGIGGGENGKGAKVTITGGIVEAHAGENETYYKAIGPGRDSDDYGTLELGDQMMVRYKIGNDWSEPVPVNSNPPYGRKAGAWYHTEARIEPCSHPGATYSDGGSSVSVSCIYCLTDTIPYTFQADGNWNDGSKWLGSLMPHDGNDVAVKADATIPTDCCAHVGNITIDGGSLTIADGGQLMHNSTGVTATVQKNITGHGDNNNGGWNFIAAPLVGTTQSSDVTNLISTTSENYDLYYYDEDDHYWRNYKAGDGSLDPNFDLNNGQGYLYANHDNVGLQFEGILQAGDNGTYTVENLGYACEDESLRGFNLVGNPFPCNATIDQPFYVINGRNVVPNTGSTIIPPCTGVMVQVTASGQSVTFTKTTAQQSSQQNQLQIMLSQAVSSRSTAMMDKAIVSFNESDKLEKFHFGNDAKLYIPQDGKDYAVVNIGTDVARNVSTEIPVNFKATEDGEYTITVNPEGVEMGYLHLIDNTTGADVDLLVTNGRDAMHCVSTYTFTAKTTDYESRFKLVFSAIGDADGDDDAPFAYISNGNIIINDADAGNASLQVIDVMGRVLVCRDAARHVSTSGMTPGVYVLRLINGNDVKTQKIIIE